MSNDSNPVLTAGISGAITGGSIAGLSTLFSRDATKLGVLKALLAGGATYGGLGAGSTAIGMGLMGHPKDDESTGYTRRGALGGAIGGATLGGGLGALVGSGKLGLPKKSPLWLLEYANKLKAMKNAPKVGAAIGALGIGAAAAHSGADEGMQLDVIENELRSRRREQYG